MAERGLILRDHEARGASNGTVTQVRRVLNGSVNVPHYFGNPVRLFGDWELSHVPVGQCDNGQIETEVQCDVDDTRTEICRSPFGRPCDLLYVREAWQYSPFLDAEAMGEPIIYRASWNTKRTHPMAWRPSVHMGKDKARTWLRVKRVWVERVEDGPWLWGCEFERIEHG